MFWILGFTPSILHRLFVRIPSFIEIGTVWRREKLDSLCFSILISTSQLSVFNSAPSDHPSPKELKEKMTFQISTCFSHRTMDDFDLDLVDELCSSFCAPHPSEAPDDYTLKCVDDSSTMLSRKRTSTISALDTSMNKKVCLNDVTNRSMMDPRDEMQTLDESALQMLVSFSVSKKNAANEVFYRYFQCEEWEPPSQFPSLMDRVAGLLEKHRNIRSLHSKTTDHGCCSSFPLI